MSLMDTGPSGPDAIGGVRDPVKHAAGRTTKARTAREPAARGQGR